MEIIRSIVEDRREQKAKEKVVFLEETENLKIVINTFLWSNLPESATLGDADDLACALLFIIEDMQQGKKLADILKDRAPRATD